MKQTKDAYYFSHDSNASEDPKCIKLINTHGVSAYGLFWILLEKLRQQQNYKLTLDVLPYYARCFNTEFNVMESIVSDFDLFVVKDGSFYSESLIRRMKLVNKRREQLAEAGRKGYMQRIKNIQASQNPSSADAQLKHCLSNADTQHELSLNKAQAIKVKESKGKESKFNRPSLAEIETYCKECNSIINPTSFFDYYEANGWVIGKNRNPMKDWKAAVRTWGRNSQGSESKLGVGEYLNSDGHRTYGTDAIVPTNAPPRPSDKHYWHKTSEEWRTY